MTCEPVDSDWGFQLKKLLETPCMGRRLVGDGSADGVGRESEYSKEEGAGKRSRRQQSEVGRELLAQPATWASVEKSRLEALQKVEALKQACLRMRKVDQLGVSEEQIRAFWKEAVGAVNARAPGACRRCGGGHSKSRCDIVELADPGAQEMGRRIGLPALRGGAIPEAVWWEFWAGRQYVDEALKPWARSWRMAKGEQNWQRVVGERVVNLTVEHLDVRGCEEVRTWLESQGIQSPDQWRSLDLVVRRGAGGVCTRNVRASLKVMVTEELRCLLCEQPSLRKTGEEVLRLTASCLEEEDSEEVLSMESELFSESDEAKEKLRGMTLTLRQLGATEADLVALVELNLELAGERMQASRESEGSVHSRQILTPPTEIWGSRVELGERPASLAQMWAGSTKGGTVRVRARCQWPRAAQEQYRKLMNVAGSREFLGRRADVINTAKATGVLSAKFLGRIAGHGGKVWIGVPAARTELAAGGELSSNEQAAVALRDKAPPWLRVIGAYSKWRPAPQASLAEKSSAVCIRFRQEQASERGPPLTRLSLQSATRAMLELIRRAGFPESSGVRTEEVEVAAYWTAEGRMHGMILINKTKHRELEEQVALGLGLAFCIGNRNGSLSKAQYRWCPCLQTVGHSVCQLAEVKHAVGQGRYGRRKVSLGQLFDGESELARNILCRLNGGVLTQSPLRSMRGGQYHTTSAQRMGGQAGKGPSAAAAEESRWVPRPANQILIVGSQGKPTVEELRRAFEDVKAIILGLAVTETEGAWMGRLTLADPVECQMLVEKHEKEALQLNGRPLQLQLVQWQDRPEGGSEEWTGTDGEKTEMTLALDVGKAKGGAFSERAVQRGQAEQRAESRRLLEAAGTGDRMSFWQRQIWAYCVARGFGARNWVGQGPWVLTRARDWEKLAAVYRCAQGQVMVSGCRWITGTAAQGSMQSTIGANQEVLAALRQGRMLSNHERQSLQATWVAAGDRIEDGSQVWQAESELGESGLVDVLKEMGHSLLASEYDAGPGEIEETEELGERDPTKTQDRLRVGCGQLDRTNWYRDWWRAVEAACNWERRRVDGNVITWNIGGEDVLFLLPHIQKTLAKGAAVVMLQELRFHRKKRGRVKAALEALDSNYAVHLARGKLKSKEHDIGAGKLKDRDWAVVTFLHREAFNSGKTVEREWAQGMQQQGAERQFRGRVLWLDAVTASGKAVWIANVHMPTARALDGRQRVFTALQARIAEKKGQMGMLGGDLNAAGHGGVRRNYAAGSAHININADGQLWEFLQMTGGELHSANAATRVGLLSRDVSEAQLDHLVTWNIADERIRGSACWVGGDAQDHAQVSFCVDEKTLGENRPRGGGADGQDRQPKVKNFREIAPELNDSTERKAGQLLVESKTGTIDAEEAMKACLENRQSAARTLRSKGGTSRRKVKGPKRLAHRSARQNRIVAAQAATETALKLRGGEREITGVELACLREMDLEELIHERTRKQLGGIVKLREWKEALSSLRNMQKEELQRMTEEQIRIQCKRLEKAEWKKIVEENGGLQWFTGKKKTQPLQSRLKWTAMVGGVWLAPKENEPAVVRKRKRWTDGVEQMKAQLGDRPLERLKEVVRQQWGAGTRYMVLERSEEQREDIERWLDAKSDYDWNGLGLAWEQCPADEVSERKRLTVEPLATLLRKGQRELRREQLDVAVWAKVEADSVIQVNEEWLRPKRGDMDNLSTGDESWVSACTRLSTADAEIWVAGNAEASSRLGEWATVVARRAEREGQVLGDRLQLTEIQEGMEMTAVHTRALLEVWQIMQETEQHVEKASWRRVLLSEGPWEGLNMRVAWESYFQREGFSVNAECGANHCKCKAQRMVVRPPEAAPITEAEPGRRKVLSFCEKCWQCTCFRGNATEVKDMKWMENLGIFEHRTAEGTTRRLRKELEEEEWARFIEKRLKWGVAPGPDGVSSDLIKTMSRTEKEVLRVWVNQILTTGDKPREITDEIRNGTIALLHKGSDTTELFTDWRPIVLLNTVSQLVDHIIESRLRRILEENGILEPGQAGYRMGRSTDVNMSKISYVTQQAQRLSKGLIRTDVDFKNAFNSMNQSALWQVMRKLHIPDVDLLESIYQHTTVRMAPNGAEEATIIFQTGVAQGSVLSPLLFILFVNVLARMLTAVGRQQGVEHEIRNIPGFNNLFFCDDLSMVTSTERGMQQLLGVLEEFESWSGIRLNLKKTVCMRIGKGAREQQPELNLRYRGKAVRVAAVDEPIRYLGFWATADGDFAETKRRVIEKTKQAIDRIQHHPLTPELAWEVFVSQGVGAFRYSAAVVDWNDAELEELERLWVQGYKAAWHLNLQTASVPFTLPTAGGGLGLPVPVGILTAALVGHVQRATMHEDVTRDCMVAALEEAKKEALVNDFEEMQVEVKGWTWTRVGKNVWLRLAKGLGMLNVNMELRLAEEGETGKLEKSWAESTRHLRQQLRRVKKIEEAPEHWRRRVWEEAGEDGPNPWQLNERIRRLARKGEQSFWNAAKKLYVAGVRSPLQLPFQVSDGKGKKVGVVPRALRATMEGDGCQQGRPVVLDVDKILTSREKQDIQNMLDLVDWKGLGVALDTKSRRHLRLRAAQVVACEECGEQSAKQPGLDPGGGSKECRTFWQTAAKRCEACEVQKQPHGQRVQKAEARLRGISVAERWELAIALREKFQSARVEGDSPGAWEEVLGEVEKVGSRDRTAMLMAVFHWIWNEEDELLADEGREHQIRKVNQVWERVEKVQPLSKDGISKTRRVLGGTANEQESETKEGMEGALSRSRLICEWLERCAACQGQTDRWCTSCAMPWCSWCCPETRECFGCGQNAPAKGIRKRSKAGESNLGRLYGRNMHQVGACFVDEVTACRWVNEAEKAGAGDPAEAIEFRCSFRGKEQQGRSEKIRELLQRTDNELLRKMVDQEPKVLLFFPASQFPRETPEFEAKGWWYEAREMCYVQKCNGCGQQKMPDEFGKKRGTTSQDGGETVCSACRSARRKKSKMRRQAEPRSLGMRCVAADPRYVGRGAHISGGDVIVDVKGLRAILKWTAEVPEGEMEAWMTTEQMGFPVRRGDGEIKDEEEEWRKEGVGRWLAPQITDYIRERQRETMEQDRSDEMDEALSDLDGTWSRLETRESGEKPRRKREWERESHPLAKQDPTILPDVSLQERMGKNWFLNEQMPRSGVGRGYVRVQADAVRWEERNEEGCVRISEGLATCFSRQGSWTIMSAQWNFLRQWSQGENEQLELIRQTVAEVETQEKWEREGLRSFSWRFIRSLQQMVGATVIIGGTTVATPPYFDGMGRGQQAKWGSLDGAAVVLWDFMSADEQKQWAVQAERRADWILVRRARKKQKGEEADMPPGKVWKELSREEEGPGKRKGRAMRERNWWSTGNVKICESRYALVCQVPESWTAGREKEEAWQRVEEAWFSQSKKDDIRLRRWGREAMYWLGTEAGSLGAYGFNGAVLATDGSEQRGKMGAGFWGLGWEPVGEEWEEVQEEDAPEGKRFRCQAAVREIIESRGLTWESRQRLDAAGAEEGDLIVGQSRCFKIRDRRRKGHLRVGRAEEGASSLRPELAALEAALEAVEVEKDLLLLVDCRTALTEIEKWIGEGSKVCMATVKDADILRAVIERLRKRIEAGAATFLVKIKAHRGEPLNEGADDEADRGCQIGIEEARWNEPTGRTLFTWKSEKGITRRAVWGLGVRQAITKKAGWLTVAKEKAAGNRAWWKGWWQHWKWEKKVSQEEAQRALEESWWEDDETWDSINTGLKGQMEQQRASGLNAKPVHRTWTADFMLREGQSRSELGKWLRDSKIALQKRRRMLQVLTNSFPCGVFLHKIGKLESDRCRLCQKLGAEGPKEGIARETVGHIQSARCRGQREVVIAAHNRCVRAILKEVQKGGKQSTEVQVITEDGECSMTTLWQRQELLEICAWEQVKQAAWTARMERLGRQGTGMECEDEESNGLWACEGCQQMCSGREDQVSRETGKCCQCRRKEGKSQQGEDKCKECWWASLDKQRFDGVVIDRRNKVHRLLILEFKRRSDTRAEYWQEGMREAKEQYEDLCRGIMECVRDGWECCFVPIVAGTKSMKEEAWNEAMEKFGVAKVRWSGGRVRLMRVLLEEHEKVLGSFWAQVLGGGKE